MPHLLKCLPVVHTSKFHIWFNTSVHNFICMHLQVGNNNNMRNPLPYILCYLVVHVTILAYLRIRAYKIMYICINLVYMAFGTTIPTFFNI